MLMLLGAAASQKSPRPESVPRSFSLCPEQLLHWNEGPVRARLSTIGHKRVNEVLREAQAVLCCWEEVGPTALDAWGPRGAFPFRGGAGCAQVL